MLKYLTPYLLKNARDYFDRDYRKVFIVYCDKIENKHMASIAAYSEDLTEIVDGFAWIYEEELVEYSPARKEVLQEELDDIWSEWDEEEEWETE